MLYDTSLRDGAQRRGLSYSLSDKLQLTRLLDQFGFDYIEGGWPGSNPKDAEYFAKVRDMDLQHAKIAAFGSTRRVGKATGSDGQLRALLDAQTSVVTLVGKTWSLHVSEILRTTLAENTAMIADSIKYFKDAGREVIFDAEHFFDGFYEQPQFALDCLHVASEAGADCLVLCDTNGGSLPEWVASVVTSVRHQVRATIGVHTHNDADMAVANAIAAVNAGAVHLQGTINGYGERCGNANLVSLLPTLVLKMGKYCHAAKNMAQLTSLSRQVSEVANIAPDAFAAYVGANAFTHKGGIHASAVARLARSYEHVPPDAVGNHNDVVVSELAGFSNVQARALRYGFMLTEEDKDLLQHIKAREAQGLHIEAAEGSFELMLHQRALNYRAPFELLDFKVSAQRHEQANFPCQATCKLRVGTTELLTVAEAQGPVAAIDAAMRSALIPQWPILKEVRLTDYTVRILDPQNATAAITRVIIEAAWHDERWSTVGASDNIIAASAQALMESFELFIVRKQMSVSRPQLTGVTGFVVSNNDGSVQTTAEMN